MHQAKWMKTMIYRWVADNERSAATLAELKARQERQFGGARAPCLNVQRCDRCGRDYEHPSFLLMAFSDNGEIVRRNYLKSMKESELKEMIRTTPEEGGLPFLNLAWQNRDGLLPVLHAVLWRRVHGKRRPFPTICFQGKVGEKGVGSHERVAGAPGRICGL